MPIYEFRCERCDKDFEILVFKGDSGPVTCPECGGKQVSKLMGQSGLIGPGKGTVGACGSVYAGGFS